MALFSIDGVFTWGRFFNLTLKSIQRYTNSTSVFDIYLYLRFNIGYSNVFFP